MKRLGLLFLLPFFYSCIDECEGVDCLSEDSFAFNIKSKPGGEDLIFGEDPTITEENLEVFYMVGETKEPADIRFETSAVRVMLIPEVTEYFVSALGETDTLNINVIRSAPTECCPATTAINNIEVKGDGAEGDTWVIALD